MHVSGIISGGAPVIKSYQVGETTIAGIVLFAPATAGGGLIRVATAGTAVISSVGLGLDAVTYTTTQGTGANSAERLARVVINPDAILMGRLSGNATSGTSLSTATTTSASAGGVTVTDTAAPYTSSQVDGTIWGVTGANAGQRRAITTFTDTSNITVVVPFDYAIAVGDTFTWTNLGIASGLNEVLFTTIDNEIDAQAALDTSAQNFAVVDLICRGVTDSYAQIVARDSVFANTTA
jgi:hypothetical protein